MAKIVKLRPKPQSRPIRWDIYRAAAETRLIGTVEAPTADDALKVAAAEYQVSNPRKLIAVRRP